MAAVQRLIIKSEIFSAHIIVGMLVFARGIHGKIEASQTLKPCTPNTLRRAVLDAANYGELTPIGSAALEVYPGFNAIGEWTGRNLNLGFSVKPFEEVGLVFTTMWNQLIDNCDYGCNIRVPDYDEGVPLPENMITYRPVWSFKLSLDVKF